MDKLWQYLSAGAAALAGILYALLQWRTSQRDAARTERDQERDNREVVERVREREGDIREARQGAREEAAENAEDIEDSRRRGERDRGLDNDRL